MKDPINIHLFVELNQAVDQLFQEIYVYMHSFERFSHNLQLYINEIL